ncbi:MAG: hypothetical protein JWO07_258 [Candidatus Saccharibacteria bacterium]|nr:hypothetical protein [Candidatus Saccharibacteria bacterium]
MNLFAWVGVASAVINAIAFIPYVRSVLKGKTKPERSSWWIWAGLMIIAVTAQIAVGATWSVLFTIVFLIGDTAIGLLSLKYGYGKFSSKDAASIALAIGGVYLWYLTGSPLIALIVTIGVDFLGNVLTIMKSWRSPYSENVFAWLLMTLAAVLSVVSVGRFEVTYLLFPFYVVIMNLVTVSTVTYRRSWRSKRIKSGLKKTSK